MIWVAGRPGFIPKNVFSAFEETLMLYQPSEADTKDLLEKDIFSCWKLANKKRETCQLLFLAKLLWNWVNFWQKFEKIENRKDW